jgi:hypothetical protein
MESVMVSHETNNLQKVRWAENSMPRGPLPHCFIHSLQGVERIVSRLRETGQRLLTTLIKVVALLGPYCCVWPRDERLRLFQQRTKLVMVDFTLCVTQMTDNFNYGPVVRRGFMPPLLRA